MRTVMWKDLQYGRELHLYNKLRPVLEHLRRKHKEFTEKTQQLEKEFFNHLSHSVKLDKLDSVSQLLRTLNETLKINTKINLFLFRHPVSNAQCIPRYGLRNDDRRNELVVLVSQHFLNELKREEQVSILGHELGHLLFGHVHIPAKVILESTFALADVRDLKSDLLKWMTCTEISCDMIGLACCGCNHEAFSRAMLKYTTGLTDQAVQTAGRRQNLTEMFTEQFEEVSALPFDSALTTHPLTPLRLKIAKEACNTTLFARFGQPASERELAKCKAEFDQIIDQQIGKVYPEIIPNKPLKGCDIRFELCVAVALADGEITKHEVLAIGQILGQRRTANDYMAIAKQLKSLAPAVAAKAHVERAVRETKNQSCSKSDIVSILRSSLIVAASDGRIESAELDVIYDYSKHFGVSKQEIAVLTGQMFSQNLR